MPLFRKKKTYRRRSRKKGRFHFGHKMRKLSLFVVIFSLIGGSVYWIYKNNVIPNTYNWGYQQFVASTANNDFVVRNILIEGRTHTSPEVLRKRLGIKAGDPLMDINPEHIRQNIEQINWVSKVIVERRLPDTLYIRMEERPPIAWWQNNRKLYLLDNRGDIIEDQKFEQFPDLVIFIGQDAPKHSYDFISLLKAEPEIMELTERAEWIGNRRWDIILGNGIRIKLPAEDAGFALKRLAEAHENDSLLQKELVYIDMRRKEYIALKTKSDRTTIYKASTKLKNKKEGNAI